MLRLNVCLEACMYVFINIRYNQNDHFTTRKVITVSDGTLKYILGILYVCVYLY